MKVVKKIFLMFPLLFMIELIFGFSGTMLIIRGVAIRHILFILTFLSLYGYFFIYLLKNKIKIFSLDKHSYFGSYSWIDILAIVFEVSMILSMTVIPYIMGTDLHMAYSEVFDSAAIFSLYFPLSYLIKQKEYSIDTILNILKYLIFLFAIMHIVFYFGQEFNSVFIQSIFDGISDLFGGNSQAPLVVLGHGGYTRVMFTTSIYLIVGIYIYLKQIEYNTWYNIVIFVVEILAIITTVTKSLWFGILIAILIYLLMGIIGNRKNKKYLKHIILSVVLAGIVIILSNIFIFNNIVTIRMENAFVTETQIIDEEAVEAEDEEARVQTLDKAGAAESNQIKLEQAKRLTQKWLQAPVFGWGYGSYIEDYLRSEEAPFSYEMQFFALLMKIGIAGMAVWAALIIVLVKRMVQKNIKQDFNKMSSWLFLLLAMMICVQTNPLLISFTGMSVVLLIVLISVAYTHE